MNTNNIAALAIDNVKTVKWTVWVGGTEVNDYALTYEQAQELSEQYRLWGYDDVEVDEYRSEPYEERKRT